MTQLGDIGRVTRVNRLKFLLRFNDRNALEVTQNIPLRIDHLDKIIEPS